MGDGMLLVEGSILIPLGEWEEIPPKGRYLRFGLVGALITKSRNESNNKPCIVVEVDDHYEVHKVRKKEGKKGESIQK